MTLTFKTWLFILTIPLIIALLLAGLLVYSLLWKSENDPVVQTKLGAIEGLKADDGDYNMFLGVPYAYVNESNVFGSSIASENFVKPFKAHNESAICPQFEEFNKTVTGSLDCLTLNIYVPKSACCKKVPVLVFIHGGEYQSGSGGRNLYGPQYLMKHDIIVVTVNYRVGPYGFLCIDTSDVSGNQGLKDQVLALRWIRDNIESFGGNRDQVTLSGVGSGGENVNLHLIYGKENLFQKAIIESGIFVDQLDEEDGLESIPIELADKLRFEADNETEAMNFLKKQNPKSVIASSMSLQIKYGPCIERNSSKNTFITNNIRLNTGRIKTLPVLIGQSNKEMLKHFAHRNFVSSDVRQIYNDDLVDHFRLSTEQLRYAVNNVSRFYMKGNETIKSKIVDFKSDLYHNYPTKRMIDAFVRNGAHKLYYSVFSHSGGNNFAKRVYNISGNGATQGDVLGYLFDMPFVRKPINDEDQLVIERMTTLWANFVKFGNPTPTKTDLIPVKWEPVTAGKRNYMEISSELKQKVTPFSNRTAFWDKFYKANKELAMKFIEPWKIL